MVISIERKNLFAFLIALGVSVFASISLFENTQAALIASLTQVSILGSLFWLTHRDVLRRQQAEIELRQKGTQLEEARDAAVSGAKMKSQFLANMSHEIRTPINGVLGMTEILLETELAPKQREFAETILSSANALLTIINDILDFSKIEAGMLRFESIPFDLHKTVEGVIDLFAQAARKKELELAVLIEEEVPVSVVGDPFRLRQVITNLLGNAIKFTERGEVILHCRKLPSGNGTVSLRFEVKDTGTGIATKNQDLLFNPFVQADGSTTRRFGGTGLGLAICKQLVIGMGGELGVESAPERGSTFWFSAKFLPSKASVPAAAVKGDISNLRVLLVDDNAANRKILHYQVCSWGMRDSIASSGPHALNVLRRGAADSDPFAIVILDAQMPELSGLQVAKLIRADPTIAAVKIVLLTLHSPEDLNASLRREIDACVTKPVKQSQLFEKLCAVVGIHGDPPVGALIEHERPSPPTESKRLNILLAEDNEVNQRVALYQLRMLEHRVDLATNGVEAVKLFDQNDYDVVLMDINMPELDGYEATAEIRRHEGSARHTPIIAMTANALPADREKCLAAGMDDYLAKPVQLRSLLFALEKSAAHPELLAATDLQSLVDSGIGDLVPQLISIFFESAPVDIERARLALRNANYVGVTEAAHSLKGSCSNFGAARLRELCQKLEDRGRSESLEAAAEILVSIENEFNRVRTELLAFLQLQPA